VQSVGTLAPGNSIGTLTGTTATFQSGSLFSLEGSNQFLSRLDLSGAVTINLGAQISFNIQDSLTESSYTLLTAASGLEGTVQFTLSGALPSGYELQYVNTALNLVRLPPVSHWLGQSNSTWSGENWATDAAGTPTTRLPDAASDITFSAEGAENQTAIVLDEDTTINSLTVNSSAGIQGNKTLTITNDLRVNSGEFTLSDGVTVTNDDGNVGYESGSNGTVIVNDGTWTNESDLTIGNEGTGSLTINGTGHVTSYDAYIGDDSDSNGTVIVSGGTWTIGDDIRIGNYGTGSLTITGTGNVTVDDDAYIGDASGSNGTVIVSGGTWTNDDAYIGEASGSNGTVIVSGGTWTIDDDIQIGNGGTGSLTITGTGNVTVDDDANIGRNSDSNGTVSVSGGTWTNDDAYIGEASGSNGTVSVSGGTWTIDDRFAIGSEGTGSLTITGTGNVTNGGDAYIGRYSDSNGTVSVSGGTWTVGDGLAIGDSGTGSLSINGTGNVTSGGGVVGKGSGSNGTVSVSGGSWTNSFELVIGDEGTGSLSINGTGNVTSSYGYVGRNSGSTGTVSVSGGSWTNNGELVIGDEGTGSLTITGTGNVSVDGDGTVGAYSGSNGTVSVSGGTWTNTGDLFVGVGGTGSLTIKGTGNVSNSWGIVGHVSGSNGTVSVSGGTWTNNDFLLIGNEGTGSLTINGTGNVSSSVGKVGNFPDGKGLVSVSGGAWTNTGDLTIGNEGIGSLTINGAGHVSNSNGYVGYGSGSNGTVSVSGGTWTNNGSLTIGNNGIGSLTITGTGNVTNTSGVVGLNAGSNGTVSVSGGTWTNNGNLTIGGEGTGSLTINGTGRVIVGDTLSRGEDGTIALESGGTLQIGNGGPTGTLATALTNNGTLIFDLNGGGSTVNNAISGTGAFIKNGTGSVTLVGTNTYTGTTIINEGWLVVSGTASLASSATTVNGGSLGGDGTLGDVTINSGGRIAPGGGDGVTITVGNLTLHGGGGYLWTTASINGTAGTNWSLIASAGALTLNATSGNPIQMNLWGVEGVSLDGVKRASWEIGNFTSGISGFDKTAFAFTSSSMPGSVGTYFMSLGAGNTTLVLNYKTGAIWNTASGNWSTASQWEDEARPENGDSIEFSGSGGTSTNNGYLTSIEGLNFTSSANGSYTVNGTALTIGAEGIVNDSANSQSVALDLALGVNQTFAANTANLIVSGTISGNATLTKAGNQTLTLSGNNSYTGGTTISAGTLALGGAAGAITGDISVDSGATFAINRSNNVTISNLISGNGSFAQVGSGVTSIGRNNTYSGGSTIQNGTLWAKARQALGTGRVALNGGQLLISSRQEMAANLQVGGNFSWTDGTIAFYDTGSSPASGDLTIGVAGTFAATSGDKTFDFSQVAALDYGTYTLVNATTISAGGVTFLATHGPSTTLFGNFTTTNQTIVYTVTGATSGGSDIQNNGGPNTPVVANYNISVPTITVGASNMVSSLTFTGSNPLTINSEGQLMVSSGTVNVQNGSSVVGGGTLIAPAGLNKEGEGELDVTNTAMVTGTAAVNGGLLSVNGGLVADSVVVNTGGMLGGAGLIASNVIVSGGLAPGNSPGTLTISGNLGLNSGSNTIIEIASPTNFDRIVVGGTATLGGTLNAVGDGGYTIAPGSRFDFLQAGSIVGAFDSITAPEGLRARFLSSGTIGTLLFGPGSYVPMAINPNQVSVAKALDTFIVATDGDRLAVSIALDALTTEQFPSAFDQIMPGFYESLANIAIEQAFAQTQMLNQRISSVRLGAAGFQAIGGISQPLVHDKNGKSAAEAKDASPIVESATATNWNAWALGTGMFSRSTNLGSLQNYNNDAGGFLVGADYRWSENFVTGLYGGYDYSYAEYNGGGSTKGNSFSFGTYASYAKDGYYADAVIGGGYTGFQTQRSIQFSTIDRTASADPNSGQFTAGINLGKDFEVGKFTLGPIVGAQYTYAGIGSFTESGAESLDLSLGQQNANSLRSTLGGRIAYTWNLNQKIALIPEVRMFWQHEFLNNPRNISASLDGGNGGSFDFKTSDPYRNSVFAGAGITAQFRKNLSGSVFYNVNFGSQTYQSNMVSVGLNFGF
jgi:T5SS/PEP-CTERM-associated repeat protein/autotransporter-associated beta strand protein